MIDSLISSKTRIKLLMKFFLNPGVTSYLRGLADEFGESTNAVRVELNRLCSAGFLEEVPEGGRKRTYRACRKHPLFPELQRIVRKVLGIDQVVEGIVERLGTVRLALITGDYAHGIDSGIIDLTLVGEIDRQYLGELVEKVEGMIARKVRVLVLTPEEYETLRGTLRPEESLFVWGEQDELLQERVRDAG
nr:ArsR family transcriptional regulator [uncultured Fretibacterium sp.]